MSGVDPAALEITNQMLGEGEVAIQIKGERRWRIQESVFTGLWRCCEVDAAGPAAGRLAGGRRGARRGPAKRRARRRPTACRQWNGPPAP